MAYSPSSNRRFVSAGCCRMMLIEQHWIVAYILIYACFWALSIILISSTISHMRERAISPGPTVRDDASNSTIVIRVLSVSTLLL